MIVTEELLALLKGRKERLSGESVNNLDPLMRSILKKHRSH